MKSKTYEEFVEKFKPKKTTDDCYTPPQVYEAVKNWAVGEYDLHGSRIMRPFYPEGDYKSENYTEDSVVIDNPPFSILSEILKFYLQNGVRFFLFAPHLTLFSANLDVTYLVTDSQITYENGAVVKTSFITNLDTCRIRTAPGLMRAIESSLKTERAKMPKYNYPPNVVTSSVLARIKGEEFKIDKSECHFTRALDDQRKEKKAIFGAGFLVSDSKAAELKATELKVKEMPREWRLSEREKEIIKEL